MFNSETSSGLSQSIAIHGLPYISWVRIIVYCRFYICSNYITSTKNSNKYCVSDWEQFKILPIWYNNYFTIGGKSFLFRDFYENGIVLVDDLLGNNSDFHRVEYIVNTLNIRTNCLQYNGLISSIKRTLRQFNITIPTKEVETTPSQLLIIKCLTSFNRGCRKSYDIYFGTVYMFTPL